MLSPERRDSALKANVDAFTTAIVSLSTKVVNAPKLYEYCTLIDPNKVTPSKTWPGLPDGTVNVREGEVTVEPAPDELPQLELTVICAPPDPLLDFHNEKGKVMCNLRLHSR